MFEKYLQEIGLSDKEALVYLNLLNSGNSSVADISQKTKIKRPTVYTIVESLSKKGLVSETTIGSKTKYQAESPERLKVFVERQKILLEEKSKILNDVIPELLTMRRDSFDKPVVKYYEGKDGVVSSLEELFSSKEKEDESIYFIYPKDKVDELWTEKDRQVYKKRREIAGLKSKTIYTWPQSEIPQATDGSIRLKIDSNKFPLKADIAIYGDKVKIHTLTNRLSGIFIQNKDVADTLKSLIDYILSKN